VFETYRMLGEQREAELLHEALRLQAGQAAKDGTILRTPRRRLVSVFRSSAVAVLTRLRRSSTRAAEKHPRSQLDLGRASSLQQDATEPFTNRRRTR
jgi:hypothetical protein